MADPDRRDLTRMVRSVVAQGGAIADRTRQALTDGEIIEAMARTIEAAGVEFVRRWHRLEVTPTRVDTDGPVLFVANHGFGGIIDLNVFALVAALGDLELDRPVTFLVHELAWTLRLNALIEPLGAQPAGPDAAREAFARGDHVVVFPGGDLDAFKAFPDRNRVVFGGRTGFARLALEESIPIVPVVTAGAGSTLFVVSSGRRLARFLRLDRIFRLNAIPITVSIPWGVSVGAVGLFPYIPLPGKLRTRVLPPVSPELFESADDLADAVIERMQSALDDLAAATS